MKYWEFLIQKEGDDTWLPLETHQVEILEGRYRVVAHTDRTNTPINVCVSQVVTSESSPRRHVRNHTSQTNSAGLAVVIPYVQLDPGQWELTCSSQGAADLDDWQYTVQLQVFGNVAEGDSDWPLADAETDKPRTGDQGQVSQFESSLPANPDLPLAKAQAYLQTYLQTDLPPAYGIILDRQAFFAQNVQPMTIAGQVQALTSLASHAESHLWLRLQDPQSGQVIMEAHRPINLDRLPADFKVKIQLPARVTTQIVWGQVSLRSAPDAEQPGAVLSAAAFTITAGIAQLLEDISDVDQFDQGFSDAESEEMRSPLAAPSRNGSTHSGSTHSGSTHSGSTFNGSTHNGSIDSAAHSTSPAVGVVLPSQHVDSVEPTPKTDRVQLPPMVTKPAQFVGTSIEDDDLETAEIAALLENIDDDLGSVDPAANTLGSRPSRFSSAPEFSDDSISDDSIQDDPTDGLEPAAIEPISPYHRQKQEQESARAASRAAFKSLNLKNHFMQRLSSLTHDEVDQANKFAEELQAAGVSSEGPQAFTQADARANSEVVIFDEPPVAEDDPSVTPTASVSSASVSASPSPSLPRALPGSPPRIGSEPVYSEPVSSRQSSESGPVSHSPVSSPPDPQPPISRAPSLPPASLPSASLPPINPSTVARSSQPHIPDSEDTPQGEIPVQYPTRYSARYSASNPVQHPVQRPSQYGSSPSLPPSSRSTADLSTAPLSDADRTRQLRLARLRQRQAEARAALAADSPSPSQPIQPPVQPAQTPSSVPTSAVPTSAVPTSALTLYRNGEQAAEDRPEMVLPVISVPRGDLVAGDMVTITVRTRPSMFKPFIKLWMIDRQSRTVVGEPKLLTDMKPDALGDLQTSTELLVPRDCLDVQIAAIAIDIATQQESNKAIVNRHVIPPTQSLPPLRTFQARDW